MSRISSISSEELNEEERLISLTPHHDDFNLADFQRGLRLNDKDFQTLERRIQVEFDLSGILEVDSLDGPEAQAKVRRSVANLLYYLGQTEPPGPLSIPLWYMSSWLKAFSHRSKGDRGDSARLKRIGLSPTSEVGLSRPAATYDPNRVGNRISYPEESFSHRVQHSSLDQMTIRVLVWRVGTRHSSEEPEVVASRLLATGKEAQGSLATSYSFALFTNIFEEKMNARKPKPEDRVDMKYGKLGYFTHSGEHKAIVDQDGFEVAIQHLYLNRENGDLLKFVFQPEAADSKTEREAAEKLEKTRVVAENQAAGLEADEGSSSVLIGSPNPSDPASPHTRVHSPGGLESLFSPLTGISTIGGTAFSGLRSPTSDGGQSSQGIYDASPPHSVGRDGDDTKSRSSLGSKIRGPWRNRNRNLDRISYEERQERWKKWYKVESTIAYKRGGDDDEIQDSDIAKFHVADQAVEGEIDIEIQKEEEEPEEGTDVSEHDRVVARLQNLQNLSELSQLGGDPSELWLECCRMFNIDSTRTALDDTVTVVGLKTRLYQYQAFGVYWQMITSRRLGGGFVGDEMGLGKTLSFLAYIVVERQLSVLWLEVQKSRRDNDGKHLQSDQHSDNDVCPSPPKPGWIACPCASSSPTSKMAYKPGVRLACVPDNLVRTWWTQWKVHVDVTNLHLGLTLVIDYPPAFDQRATLNDQKLKSENARNKSRLEAVRFVKTKDGKGDDAPKDYQDGWLVLTTVPTYKKWIAKFRYDGPKRDKHGEWKKGHRFQIVFGIAMIDECHEEYFKNSGRAGVLTDLPSANQPFLWGYSGTPFSQTPRGLEGVLWAIESHAPITTKGKTGWQTDPILQQFAHKNLDSICKRFDQEAKSKKPDNAVVNQALADFRPFLLNFLIRRRAETEWFGHLLIKLKPHLHQDISFGRGPRIEILNNLIISYVAQFQSEEAELLFNIQKKFDENPETRRSNIRPEKLAFNTLCRLQWRSRILATFPWLAKLAITTSDPENRLDLTENECLGYIHSKGKEKENPYGRYIRMIVEDSPKCMWLYFFIQDVCNQKNFDGKDQKLVLITSFPQVAFILKLFIQEYVPGKKNRVGMIVPRMRIKDRIEALDAFTDALDEKGSRKQTKDYQFLIGTTRLIGKGLQLTRACNVVLMEPEYEFAQELQAYARVHRIGQKNPYSFSYRLIDSGSEIEQRILKRQVDRKEFPGRRLTEEEFNRLEPGLDSNPEDVDETRELGGEAEETGHRSTADDSIDQILDGYTDEGGANSGPNPGFLRT